MLNIIKMANKNKTDEIKEREETRKIQLGILTSEAVKNLYVAANGRDVTNFGKAGKSSTQNSYLEALSNPDEYVGQLTSMPFIMSAQEAMKTGRDIYEHGAITPIQLLESAQGFYESAINKVKVKDILGLMEIKDVHEKNISQNQLDMYMEDFEKVNSKMYQALTGTYLSTLTQIGVGESQIKYGVGQRRSLESILKEEPREKEGRKN